MSPAVIATSPLIFAAGDWGRLAVKLRLENAGDAPASFVTTASTIIPFEAEPSPPAAMEAMRDQQPSEGQGFTLFPGEERDWSNGVVMDPGAVRRVKESQADQKVNVLFAGCVSYRSAGSSAIHKTPYLYEVYQTVNGELVGFDFGESVIDPGRLSLHPEARWLLEPTRVMRSCGPLVTAGPQGSRISPGRPRRPAGGWQPPMRKIAFKKPRKLIIKITHDNASTQHPGPRKLASRLQRRHERRLTNLSAGGCRRARLCEWIHRRQGCARACGGSQKVRAMTTPDQLLAIIEPNALTKLTDTHLVPALIADLGEQASWRYVEFFTANIRNLNTRRAYVRACSRFFAWSAPDCLRSG